MAVEDPYAISLKLKAISLTCALLIYFDIEYFSF